MKTQLKDSTGTEIDLSEIYCGDYVTISQGGSGVVFTSRVIGITYTENDWRVDLFIPAYIQPTASCSIYGSSGHGYTITLEDGEG